MLLGTLVWLVSSVVQLVRYVSPLGGVEKGGLVTWSLRLEFLVSFLFGLAHLAYPGWLLGFQVSGSKPCTTVILLHHLYRLVK